MGAVKRSPRFLYRNIVLHLLAFAVIAFGLEAKLALLQEGSGTRHSCRKALNRKELFQSPLGHRQGAASKGIP